MRDYVHASKLVPSPSNAREELPDLDQLAASIEATGILEDLLVRRHPSEPGKFEVIDGHRRLSAGQMAGVQQYPVQLLTPGVKPLVAMLVTACQRTDLTAIEKARAMERLRDEEGYTQARIAEVTGLHPATVSYHFTLLDLDESTRQRVIEGRVKIGEARAAVRKVRAKTARKNGAAPRPKVTVEPDHFTARHPLAEEVRVMCELAGHTGRKLARSGADGDFGCGKCWETAIRRDERRKALADSRAEEASRPRPAVTFLAPEEAMA